MALGRESPLPLAALGAGVAADILAACAAAEGPSSGIPGGSAAARAAPAPPPLPLPLLPTVEPLAVGPPRAEARPPSCCSCCCCFCCCCCCHGDCGGCCCLLLTDLPICCETGGLPGGRCMAGISLAAAAAAACCGASSAASIKLHPRQAAARHGQLPAQPYIQVARPGPRPCHRAPAVCTSAHPAPPPPPPKAAAPHPSCSTMAPNWGRPAGSWHQQACISRTYCG